MATVSNETVRTREDIIAHMKAIGQRILDDAETFAPEPTYTTEMVITAEINPFEELSTVKYEMRRIADPRIK